MKNIEDIPFDGCFEDSESDEDNEYLESDEDNPAKPKNKKIKKKLNHSINKIIMNVADT